MSLEDLTEVRVSTASRHLEDPRKAPTAVTVISGEEIARYGWRTLADVLRSVTGFYTAYDRTYTYAGVRGFLQSGDYNARILLLIDGHRVNENIYDSAMVGTEFPLDLNLIDRVEVVRGPGSSLFGTDAELAVVNVFTRQPANQATAEVTAGAETFAGRAGEVRTSFRAGGFAALLSGSLYRSNGPYRLLFPELASPGSDNGVATNLDGDRYEHAFGMVRRGRFRLEGVFGKRDKIVPNASYSTIFGDPDNRSMDTRGYVDASYSRDLQTGTQIDLRAYYDGYRFWGSYPYAGEDGTGRQVQINDAAADGAGVEVVVAQRLGPHRVVAGATGERNFRVKQRNYYIGQAPLLDDHRRLDLAAIFGELELNPSRRFSFNLGGRGDWYNLFGNDFSPRLAAMYFPSANVALKYIYGAAFRAPDPYDEFYVDSVDITAANGSLKPEEIRTHTILLENAIKRGLNVNASWFSSNLRNVIKEVANPATGETTFANEVGDRGSGVEIEMIAKGVSGWRLRSSYTFSSTEQKQWRTRAMNSPAHLAKLNGIIPLQRAGYFGGEVLYTGSQPNYLNQRIGSSVLTNATLSTRSFGGGFQFSASCYNLLDRKWATPTGPEISAPATVQDGRTIRFRLTFGRSAERKLPAR